MKRLIVCCDGTWQNLAQDRLTNVALTARSIAPRDANGVSQVVFYSAGVGCNLGRWSGMISGAFGVGLDLNLLEAYTFLAFNYEPGDEVFLFGFSRGAYTVRSLAGLIRKCGILKRSYAHFARPALELYRTRDLSADSVEAVEFRNNFASAWPSFGGASKGHDLTFKYVGVWDTVGSLGVPRTLPFASGFNKNYQFHDLALSRAVASARHAVSIDEKRNAFSPTLWDNVDELNAGASKPRIMQRWFPGDHGGVGGGSVSAGLSNGALLWVVEGAELAGLGLERSPDSVLHECERSLDPINCLLWDNKRGFSAIDLMGASPRKGLARFEDIHESARRRWKAVKKYRPRSLRAHRGDLDKWDDTARMG